MSLTICSGLPNMHPSFQFYPHLKILPVKKTRTTQWYVYTERQGNPPAYRSRHAFTQQEAARQLSAGMQGFHKNPLRGSFIESQGLQPPQHSHGRVTWWCISPGPSKGHGAEWAVQSTVAYAVCQASGTAGGGCVRPRAGSLLLGEEPRCAWQTRGDFATQCPAKRPNSQVPVFWLRRRDVKALTWCFRYLKTYLMQNDRGTGGLWNF